MNSSRPVYILTHEFFPSKGGIATVCEEMAKAVLRSGREVEVWAPGADSEHDPSFAFPIRRLPIRGSQDLSCQLRLAREWIRHRHILREAAVYLPDPGPILAFRFLLPFKFLRPKRLLLTFHGSEIIRFASSPWQRWLIARVIRQADRISVLSSYTKELLFRRFPEAEGKTCLTPGALGSDFTPSAVTRPPQNTERLHILSVGRLHPRKGQDRVLKALSQLPSELREKIELSIVGSGNKHGYGDKLRDLASKVDFPVNFHGDVAQDALRELYSSADIFTLTSVSFRKSVEGFGLVYLEAAAYGLPIVAHRIGGVAEAVSDGENGLLVDPNDPQALSQAFARLVEDESLRQQLGANGPEWARRNDWDEAARQLFKPHPSPGNRTP